MLFQKDLFFKKFRNIIEVLSDSKGVNFFKSLLYDPSFLVNLVMADGNSSLHTVPARSFHNTFDNRLITRWPKPQPMLFKCFVSKI